MEPIKSPELEQCIKEKEALEQQRRETQDKFSNDMADASVVQGDSQNQQSELKNAIDDFVATRKEWIELQTKLSILTAEFNALDAQIGPLTVKQNGCKAAIAAMPKKK
jgi:uncharacterized protein (DUF3084 family)